LQHAASSEQVRGTPGHEQQATEGRTYASTTQVTAVGLSRRSVSTEGSATLTIKVSSITTNCANTGSPRAIRRR
jgi:hypothetical protein